MFTRILQSSIVLALACGACQKQSSDAKTDAKKDVAEAQVAPTAAAEKATPEKAAETPSAHDHASAEGEDEGCLHEKHGKHEDGHSCGGEKQDPKQLPSTGHFGAAFTVSEPAMLSAVLGGEVDEAKVVQVQGTIDTVCQSMGCWLVLKDGEQTARVLMQGGSFSVPMDSKGKTAIAEGTIKKRELTEKQVKHIAKDAGEDPAAVSGTRTEYILTATAVEVK